jgi:predicted MFS family arabinose efflux permease
MLMFAAANLIYASTDIVWIVAIGVLLVEVSIRPSGTLAMQLTMTRVEQMGLDVFGRIRSFAALGFSVASLTSMPLFNLAGYQLIFWMGAFLTALTVQVANVLPEQTAGKDMKSKPPKRRKAFYVLALSQFFTTMGIRAGYTFWLVYITRDLGLSTSQIGLFMAFVAGVEVPFFMLLDPMMKRWNPRIIYIIGSLGMAAFFLVLGFIPNIYWLIPVLIVRGALWPMYNLPIFVVTSQISHPRNVATNQAIMNVTMPSIAMLIMGSGAGWMFDHQAAWIFFVVCAIVCAIGSVVAIVGYRALAPINHAELQAQH